MVCSFIKEKTGTEPKRYLDYNDMLADKDVDAVCIGTPDHWHHKQIVDSLRAGKHVYAEKPMTKKVEDALDVVKVWKETGKVMQVGVQSTSLTVWDQARDLINNGKLGKVLGFQTEYFRNSGVGQWRYYKLEKEMSPETVDWKRWLGVKEGLAPDMDFDRALYAQWRCYWPFGSGMFTDLFVHRTTAMLKATGLRYPARVVGAGGIYMELDTRDVPDVATVWSTTTKAAKA
jgi:predicted dehydrogenase